MRGIAAGVLVVAMAVPLPLQAMQAPQAPPAEPAAARGEAYYEFLLGRRLESQGDLPGALAAVQRAIALDPTSAELQAELAGYYARQDQATEAVDAAKRALALDAENVEAHRILGLVNAAWADGATPAPEMSAEAFRAEAITHLSKVMGTPAAATDLSLQLTLARLYLRSRQPEQALPLLERIAAQAPFAAEPFALLADAHRALGHDDKAIEALEAAADINPRYAATLGELYERQRQWANAAAAYGKAAEALPAGRQRDLRLRRAAALLNVPGGAAAARDEVTTFLETNPQDPRGLYLLSVSRRMAGDAEGAEQAARQLTALDPTSLPGLSALAQALFARHEYKEVVTVLTPFAADAAAQARGRERDGAVLLARLGFAQSQLGDVTAAVGAFEAAHRLAPDDIVFELYLLQAYIGAKRFDSATTAVTEALTRHPGDERLLRIKAQALAGSGKPADAIQLLQEALDEKPQSRDLAIGLAALLAERHEYDTAISVLQRASARAADDEALTLQLASVFEEADRVRDAEREFRKLLERDPLNAVALNGLGYMLADRGERLPEAIALIQRALTVDPDNPAYLDSLGWALFKQGQTDEAEPHLRRAAAALGSSSAIQEHLGDLLARQGRYADAVAAWERALGGDGVSLDRAGVEKKIKDARGRKQ